MNTNYNIVEDNTYPYTKVIEELTRLDIDINSKYILCLQFKLFFPYINTVNASLAVKYKGTNNIVWINNIATSKPYPNKATRVISQTIGRRKSKWFIPLVLDSYDDIANIDKIFAVWEMSRKDGKKEYAVIEFDIESIAQPVKDKIYCISSYEANLNEIYKLLEKHNFIIDDNDYICLKGDEYYYFCIGGYDDYMLISLNSDLTAELLFDIHTSRSLKSDNLQNEWYKNGRESIFETIGVNIKNDREKDKDISKALPDKDNNDVFICYYRNIVNLKDDETFNYI